jgi:hypothetical protein
VLSGTERERLLQNVVSVAVAIARRNCCTVRTYYQVWQALTFTATIGDVFGKVDPVSDFSIFRNSGEAALGGDEQKRMAMIDFVGEGGPATWTVDQRTFCTNDVRISETVAKSGRFAVVVAGAQKAGFDRKGQG